MEEVELSLDFNFKKDEKLGQYAVRAFADRKFAPREPTEFEQQAEALSGNLLSKEQQGWLRRET
jgi:hypothetical protein